MIRERVWKKNRKYKAKGKKEIKLKKRERKGNRTREIREEKKNLKQCLTTTD